MRANRMKEKKLREFVANFDFKELLFAYFSRMFRGKYVRYEVTGE